MSGVCRNIDPPTPSPPGECVLPPPLVLGENTLAGGRGGWGVNSSEDAIHCSVLYICKYFVITTSTKCSMCMVKKLFLYQYLLYSSVWQHGFIAATQIPLCMSKDAAWLHTLFLPSFMVFYTFLFASPDIQHNLVINVLFMPAVQSSCLTQMCRRFTL